MTQPSAPSIAIACGGTGGHLFPGLAVAEQLIKRGCAVTLLVSPKEVDQQAVKMARDVQIVTLPAVGLQNRNYFSFGGSFLKSWLAARKCFQQFKPSAALAMGGFTSAPPILAARQFGAKTFLHESNTIPGKANRWLSRFVNQCFVGFPQAAARLHHRQVVVTGTPVRPQFQPRDPASCRTALGLDPQLPTILVMGGSQGASGINDLIIHSLETLQNPGRARHSVRAAAPQTAPANDPTPGAIHPLSPFQFFHLAGPSDVEKVRQAYAQKNLRAIVHPFFAEMDLALGAATVAVSRSGASSLAELAAVRVPSLLVPFPAATDNHQFFNAKALEETGAARLLEQKTATPEAVAQLILELAGNTAAREPMQTALAQWHAPHAAEEIAETMLRMIAQETQSAAAHSHGAKKSCGCGENRAELRAKTAA
ncbi:MAG TPA: undecaprenyldiphospho-muramoylpentapeptide beta-N-acetylglucosaminyltransferase [Verrucomicrobiae bacterium]|jgi:UDP-N-acetylglucosamine--N-acetylmuramyl-(pentapeptide) pyrophosphoryl-undecaprenol N-acetylglucosamine transferase|nr:undecaprenyldiphospho-muramoylpentapeptide beta-N-acetylglucosaminyltransferase [Verrucomicrobiae bacterium]